MSDFTPGEQADAFDAMSEQAAENDPAALAEQAEAERLAEVEFGEPGVAARDDVEVPEASAIDVHNRSHLFDRAAVDADAEYVAETMEAHDVASKPSDAAVEERRQARVLAEEIVRAQRAPVPDPAEVATERATEEVRKLLNAQDDAQLERHMETEQAADELTLSRIEETEAIETEKRRVAYVEAGYPEPVNEEQYGMADEGEDTDTMLPKTQGYEGYVDVEGRARLIKREQERQAVQVAADFIRSKGLGE